MSDKNFNMPCEDQDDSPLFLSNRGCLLDIDDSYSLSLSPDSASCNFNLSERRDCTSPVYTQSADGPILHPNNTIITLPQGKHFSNLKNTFIATPDSSSINFLNHSLSFLSCQDSEGNRTFYKTASEGSNSEVASPDSVGMSSCRMSHRGSIDLSFSSAEMVVRSNSFVLDQQASVSSSFEESPAPPVSSPDESKSLLTPLSETDGAGDQAGDHPCFGMTFVFGDKVELPSEEHAATSNSSFLALPGEDKHISTTFLCKKSDITNDTLFISSISELLYESKQIDQAKASLSEESHTKSMDLSFSSAEMVVRASFILEEQAVPSLMSSFNESLAPPTSSHIESKSLLASATNVNDDAGDQAGNHPSLGTTFLLEDKVELPSEEDGGMCNSFLALPGGKGGLHTTFLYENSTSDCANNAHFICSEAELLSESKSLPTPDKAMTFVFKSLCSVQDTDKDIHTSTPVQNQRTHLPNLPSFAVSPCTENTGSPALQPVLQKKKSVSTKQFERGAPNSSEKVTKMEGDKFRKSDMSSVKCKVMRRAVASSLPLDKPPQINAKREGNKVGSRSSPTRINNDATTPVSKAVLNRQRNLHIGVNKDPKDSQRHSIVSEESQAKSKTVHASLRNDTRKQAPAVHCCPASCDGEQEPIGKAHADPKVNIANATFCYPDKSSQKTDKVVTKPAPKSDKTNTIKKVKSGSALGHEKSTPSTPSARPRSNSESSTALSRLFKMAKPQRFSPSFSFTKSKTENPKSQTKSGNQENSSQTKPVPAKESTETNCRKVKKIGLVSHSSTLSSASCTETKTMVHGQPFPNLTGRASTSKSPAANPMMTAPMVTTPLNKQRPGASGREGNRTIAAVGTSLSKSKITSNRKAPGDTAPAANDKLSSPQHLETTPSRTSLREGVPPTSVSRFQQRKTFGPSRIQPGFSESRVQRETSDGAKTTQVSGAASRRSTPFKVPILKARLNITPAKTSAPALTAPCKTTGPTKGLPNTSSQKRITTTKLSRLTASVDKNKPKVGSRPQQQQQQQQQGDRGLFKPHQDVGPLGFSEVRRNAEKIQHLQTQLVQSNNRFEAFTVVLQQTLAQRDEAVNQSRGLSQELQELRGELVSTVNRSECLAQEKEALQGALQQALEQVQVQHHRDLQELEQRLREAHEEERRESEQRSREERERTAQTLQLQLEELRAAHEALSLELEQSHRDQLQSLRQQHQLSLDELMTSHTQELQSLSKTLKDAEMVLNEKIRELTQENKALNEKLTEEETRRREMSQKDSHTVYLEQELESIKVVLDIKNQQLHQQEKKLMEVDKLTEKSLKLEESLRKVQQENEDLKARMDRHAAMSRQLSTEQVLLQESLQKESQVNKRLSMENEELMWKLHNGDLSSPRKTSPHARSPSPHFRLHSPRSPSLFSSPPVSPR